MIQVNIDGYDKTKFIDWKTLKIQNILAEKIDKCSFTIMNYRDKEYIPIVGKEVIITDGSKIFAGHIVRVEQQGLDYKIIRYKCTCVDYTRLLQKRLVSESYENTTVEDIITDLISKYYSGYGFTTTNISCGIEIDKIGFEFVSLQSAITRLAEIVGYTWWVDYDKNIYFKNKGLTSAPFGLTDTNGNYVFKSLVVRKDNSQIKNSIIVRGGYYYGIRKFGKLICDGSKYQFRTPYKYRAFTASLTGQDLKVGIDFSGNADDYDCLYNFNEKTIKFKEVDTPSATSTLSFSGEPRLPVIVKIADSAAVDAMYSSEGETEGDYEYLIVDKSLKSKEEARDRAEAELVAYANTVEEGSFETETSGLAAGQTIYIDSDAHSVDESFLIKEVVSTMWTPTELRYTIKLISTRTIDMIGLLQKLLVGQGRSLSFDEDEIIDKINAYFEEIVFSEVALASLEHNPQAETVALSSTYSANIDYDVEFVAGPYIPTGSKRTFLCTLTANGGGARLG